MFGMGKSLEEIGHDYRKNNSIEKMHEDYPQVLDVLEIVDRGYKKEDITEFNEKHDEKYDFNSFFRFARGAGLICEKREELTGAGKYYIGAIELLNSLETQEH